MVGQIVEWFGLEVRMPLHLWGKNPHSWKNPMSLTEQSHSFEVALMEKQYEELRSRTKTRAKTRKDEIKN